MKEENKKIDITAELPDELIGLIMSFLPLKDNVHKISLTNKELREVFNSPYYAGTVEEITIKGENVAKLSQTDFFKNCINLKEIYVLEIDPNDPNNLKSLDFIESYNTIEKIILIGKKENCTHWYTANSFLEDGYPKLAYFDISHIENRTKLKLFFMKNLVPLDSTGDKFSTTKKLYAFRKLQNLVKLSLVNCGLLNDSIPKNVIEYYKLCEKGIDVHNDKYHEDFKSVISNLTSIEYLNLSENALLQLDTFYNHDFIAKLPELKTLIISAEPSTSLLQIKKLEILKTNYFDYFFFKTKAVKPYIKYYVEQLKKDPDPKFQCFLFIPQKIRNHANINEYDVFGNFTQLLHSESLKWARKYNGHKTLKAYEDNNIIEKDEIELMRKLLIFLQKIKYKHPKLKYKIYILLPPLDTINSICKSMDNNTQ